MSKSIEEQVYREFSDAVNSGDLEGAFKNATEDMTFRPIGSHPELGREFRGMQDILENCWMKVFQHIDENGVAITVNDIVTADGIAFVQFSGKATGRSGMPYNNEYVHVLRFRDGKICSITEFLDTDLFYKLLDQ
ncbi:MAG: nuclear transport factor 2 family protein [Halioglobus sp.]|nr:nuclear transport factor 2 family protein [Halioglobus sp.]MDG2326532.1 nuclear transport factor 2 family protein [Halioglobus sp.]